MKLSVVLLGSVAFALGLLIVRILVEVVNEWDAALHKKEKRIIPFPDGTITRLKHG
jgi:hypothetical protein